MYRYKHANIDCVDKCSTLASVKASCDHPTVGIILEFYFLGNAFYSPFHLPTEYTFGPQ